MNKQQLIEAVAEKLGGEEWIEGDEYTRAYHRRNAVKAVEAVLSTVVTKVAIGHTVSVTGFGTFATKTRPERLARNPQNGEKVRVPSVIIPSFRPGQNFKDLVDGRKPVPLEGSAIAKAPKGSRVV